MKLSWIGILALAFTISAAAQASDYIRCTTHHGPGQCTSCSRIFNSEDGHGCVRELRGALAAGASCEIYSDSHCQKTPKFSCHDESSDTEIQAKTQCVSASQCSFGHACDLEMPSRSRFVSACRNLGKWIDQAVCCPDNLCVPVPTGGDSGSSGTGASTSSHAGY